MKKIKMFCKFLNIIFSVFIMFFSGRVDAMDCRKAVSYLSVNGFFLKGGGEYWIFGQEYVRPEDSWDVFVKIISERFGDFYTMSVTNTKGPQALDSVNFLFLALDACEKIYAKTSDPENVRQAIQMFHLMFRDFNEQTIDKAVLQQLSEVYSSFNELKNILM